LVTGKAGRNERPEGRVLGGGGRGGTSNKEGVIFGVLSFGGKSGRGGPCDKKGVVLSEGEKKEEDEKYR